MRLLYYTSGGELSWTDDLVGDDNIPPYAILSHTWDEGQEVTFDDLKKNLGRDKTGYSKIEFCALQAKRDGLHHFWIDSCCIDKSNNVELSEAIISMFRWYQNAKRCYVYLSDVSSCASEEDGETTLRRKPVIAKSKWFTRGWTLQELIAPASVEFFSKEGERLGDKTTLKQTLHEITGIAVQALEGSPMTSFTVDERMLWAKGRNTRREEDKAYSLQGIFDVMMPPLYGEGQKNAWYRLQKEIRERYSINLPIAAGASFNSRNEEHNARCLHDTRIDLLNQVTAWAQDRDSKHMFWLSGMAGTGKSTIARTVAQSLANRGQLGASFFFKKGENERSNATRFFATIATDLIEQEPGMLEGVRQALIQDLDVSQKPLIEQFEKLVLEPLSNMSIQQARARTLARVIVIDALDECELEQDARAILRLLSRTKAIQPVPLRIFVTSRPELHIRLGFQEISKGTYQDLVLHEVPRSIIVHDIRLFLEHELGAIRKERGLASDWPTTDQILALVKLAVPLFIYAATVCRYIGTKGSNPIASLNKVLQYRKTNFSQLDLTYLPILNQLLAEQEEDEQETWLQAFQELVGSIVVLESPLSVATLSSFLQIPKEEVKCRLDSLHSVLEIPDDQELPVRILHLSFREFLLDPHKQGTNPFWVDSKSTHTILASRCLALMSTLGALLQDMRNLSVPEDQKSEFDKRTALDSLSLDLRYACRYWVTHLEQSRHEIVDGDAVHLFLQKHLLHWAAAMGVMRESRKCVDSLNKLTGLAGVRSSRLLFFTIRLTHIQRHASIASDFILDAQQFVRQVQDVLDDDPLQIFRSALLFAPETSLTRQTFVEQVPQQAQMLSKMEADWGAYLSVGEGHSDRIGVVAFSLDGQLVASASWDKTVRLWEPVTGTCRSVLKGHSSRVVSVTFSPDKQLIALACSDYRVQLWEVASGLCLSTLTGHSSYIEAVAFSPDGQLVTSASSDRTVRLWEVATGTCRNVLRGHSSYVVAVAFSPDGQLIASASSDKTARLWEVATGMWLSMLKISSAYALLIAFSPDKQLIALACSDYRVQLWEVASGLCLSTLTGHSSFIGAIAFSPDGQLFASASSDGTIRLWETTKWKCESELAHSSATRMLAFSLDGLKLHTDQGNIPLIQSSVDRSLFGGEQYSTVTSLFRPEQSSYSSVQDGWILRNQQRLLWLPLDYRASSAVHDNIVCLGLLSGRVILLRIL
jgi:WD40 repeat protein